MSDNEQRAGLAGITLGISIALSIVTCMALAWFVPIAQAEHDHEVRVNSHAYQESRREEIAIFEAQLEELDVELARENDVEVRTELVDRKRAIQKRLIRAQSKLSK